MKFSIVRTFNRNATTLPPAGDIDLSSVTYTDYIPIRGAILFTPGIIWTGTRNALLTLYEKFQFRGVKVTFLPGDFDETTATPSSTTVDSQQTLVCRADPDDAILETGQEILTSPRKKILKLGSTMKNPSMFLVPQGLSNVTNIDSPAAVVTALNNKRRWYDWQASGITDVPFYGFKYATDYSTSTTGPIETGAALMFTFYFAFKDRNIDSTA